MKRIAVVAMLCLMFASAIDASPRSRRRARRASVPSAQFRTAELVTVASSPAMEELNKLRARRGLYPFIEDESLTKVAKHKASIQARRGRFGHPGGSMGGARFEGVGTGPNFISCYQYSTTGKYAGAASARGADGRRYYCLLIR